jgi:hypothetical protein
LGQLLERYIHHPRSEKGGNPGGGGIQSHPVDSPYKLSWGAGEEQA